MKKKNLHAYFVIDLGTTNCRIFVFSVGGKILFGDFRRLGLIKGKIIRQDPNQILRALRNLKAGALGFARKKGLMIKALGIANQRSSFVFWDSKGRPLGPVYSWMEARVGRSGSLLAKKRTWLYKKTGLFANAHYSAPKLGFYAKHLIKRTSGFWGTLNTFVIWHLTRGNFFTDITNAQRTLLFNIALKKFDNSLLSLFQLNLLRLPALLPSFASFGRMPEGIPVSCAMGDQQAAALGLTGLAPDTLGINMGTGAFIFLPLFIRPKGCGRLLVSLTGFQRPLPPFLIEGTVNSAGTLIDRLNKEYRIKRGFHKLSSCCDFRTHGKVIAEKGEMFGSPIWAEAKHTAGPGKENPLPAAMAQIGYLLYENYLSMRIKNHRIKKIILGGPLSRIKHFPRFLSNLFNLPVWVNREKEVTSKGVWIALNMKKRASGMIQADLEGPFLTDKKAHAEIQKDRKAWKRNLKLIFK
jgi:glycerol kinase